MQNYTEASRSVVQDEVKVNEKVNLQDHTAVLSFSNINVSNIDPRTASLVIPG